MLMKLTPAYVRTLLIHLLVLLAPPILIRFGMEKGSSKTRSFLIKGEWEKNLICDIKESMCLKCLTLNVNIQFWA